MSKTKKEILKIAGIFLLVLAVPFILFVGVFAASVIGNEMITQKDVEEYGKKMQSRAGMIFPDDAAFVKGHWVKYCASLVQEPYAGWAYISKGPFQLPENVKVRVKTDKTDGYEKIFSRMFETNITGATEYTEARWMTNGFIFTATMLKTPEQYYLKLRADIGK